MKRVINNLLPKLKDFILIMIGKKIRNKTFESKKDLKNGLKCKEKPYKH